MNNQIQEPIGQLTVEEPVGYEKQSNSLTLVVDNGNLSLKLEDAYKIQLLLKDGVIVDSYFGRLDSFTSSREQATLAREFEISYFRFPNFSEKKTDPELYPLAITDALVELRKRDPNIVKSRFLIIDFNNTNMDLISIVGKFRYLDEALRNIAGSRSLIYSGIKGDFLYRTLDYIKIPNNGKIEIADNNKKALERIFSIVNGQ